MGTINILAFFVQYIDAGYIWPGGVTKQVLIIWNFIDAKLGTAIAPSKRHILAFALEFSMHITVTFVGILGKLIQEEGFRIALPREGTYRDLLIEIWNRFGRSIPDPLWDREASRFKAPIFALVNGRALENPETCLSDGDDVKFLTLVAGG